MYLDGKRTVIFANGTRKDQFPDGHTTIRFTNQDIKRFFSDGACSKCWSSSICHCMLVPPSTNIMQGCAARQPHQAVWLTELSAFYLYAHHVAKLGSGLRRSIHATRSICILSLVHVFPDATLLTPAQRAEHLVCYGMSLPDCAQQSCRTAICDM